MGMVRKATMSRTSPWICCRSASSRNGGPTRDGISFLPYQLIMRIYIYIQIYANMYMVFEIIFCRLVGKSVQWVLVFIASRRMSDVSPPETGAPSWWRLSRRRRTLSRCRTRPRHSKLRCREPLPLPLDSQPMEQRVSHLSR